uniref:Replication protein E1 n=1 Tax=Miniopterus schreibersii papillomavirus 1 TaxID=1195364 RepID=I3VR52_9PAPI|nr:E1 [Miniopterus schreibersii papillomavirus 1]
MDPKGTDDDPLPGCSGDWYVVREAECSDNEQDTFDELFDESQGSQISDLFDDSEVVQGNSLQLFEHLQQTESDRELSVLKRKFLQSPESRAVADLSPQLTAVTISPKTDSCAKRRLFARPLDITADSGVDATGNETASTPETLQVVGDEVDGPRDADTECLLGAQAPKAVRLLDVFHAKNIRVSLLAKFKGTFDISFSDITRTFKSDRTTYTDWVIAMFGLVDDHEPVVKTVLKGQCSFMYLRIIGSIGLVLCRFNTHKSRDTLKKLFSVTIGVPEIQLLLEPPKTTGVAAALYWYQNGQSERAFVQGPYPEWILRQTTITGEVMQHQFSLAEMVQWAYDHDFMDEHTVAYEYARLAEEDLNASTWLKSNSQAKFVKECVTMVRYYKHAEMSEMTMSAWIHKRCSKVKGTGNWKPIVQYLRFQGIPFPVFCESFKPFLKGVPKRNCMVFNGPANTGKSMFCMSLLRFLGGKVISFVNSRSQFWLQPLVATKIALLDDATVPCWNYIDTYLRNMLDGNPICLDCKHKAPQQVKCPPLLITTNVDIRAEERYKYLHSRTMVFDFTEEFPFDEDGKPIFEFNDENWKSFFERLWLQLDLSDQEDEGDHGAAESTFRCHSREPPKAL